MNPPPIVIQRGVPIPRVRGVRQRDSVTELLRATLEGMSDGDSFEWQGNHTLVYAAAKYVGCQVVTRKLESGGWQVWRKDRKDEHGTDIHEGNGGGGGGTTEEPRIQQAGQGVQ